LNRRGIGLVLCTSLLGCGDLTRREYVNARADAECQKTAVCHRGFFDSEYRDHEQCVKITSDLLDDLEDTQFFDCRFDGSQAVLCTQRVNNMGCEPFAEGDAVLACDTVWDCT
jgi:hypothetical protein